MAEHKDLWKGTVIFIRQPAGTYFWVQNLLVEKMVYTPPISWHPRARFLLNAHDAIWPPGMVRRELRSKMAGTDRFD